MSKHALGIDLGTSSVKVSLLNPNGSYIGSSSAPYPTHSPYSGWMEQDPRDWIEATSRACQALGKIHPIEYNDVGCIGLTSAAHIGVLLDDANRPLRKALLWSDQRSTTQVKALLEDEDEIYGLSANRPSTSWTLAHFLWVKEAEPEVWKELKRVCFSKDYLLHWLTGAWVTDPATAVSAQFCDVHTFEWSEKLLSYIDLKQHQFPEILPVTHNAGVVKKEIALELGLGRDVYVINGSLDSAMETYGSGGRNAGDLIIRIGTAGGIHLITQNPLNNRSLLTYPFPIGDSWYSQAGTNAAGSAIAWVAGVAGYSKDTAGFESLSELARTIAPGSEGLLFHPYLNGERTPYWDSNLRGTFSGLSFVHSSAHMVRAVYEGVCYSLRDALTAMIKRDEIDTHLVVVGGGAKDSLLMEILSSVLNCKLIPTAEADSAYGAARISQISLYHPEQLTMINQVDSSIVEPQEALIALYDREFAKYKRYCVNYLDMYKDEE